jgi:formate C-acetyltransferase
LQAKSIFETWQVRLPQDIRALGDASAIFVDRKAVRGPGELTAGYDWVIASGINGIRKNIEAQQASLDPALPEGYEKII